MLKPLMTALAFVIAGSAFAQSEAAPQRAAMNRLAWMAGVWEGASVTQTPEGEKRSISQEVIRIAAGGLAVMVQGRHWRQLPDGLRGDVVLDTAGMFTFDPATGKYRFVTQLQDGKFGVQEAEFSGDVLSWGFALPQAKARIRYDITNENGQWNERGFFCREAAPCVPFFRMTLQRTGDAP